MRKLLPAQHGDTIVEVLIAIAVASSVLAVTYATMNRNLTITRRSQERSEASKIAQGQIEALKGRIDLAQAITYETFCIDAGGNEVQLPSSVPNPTIAADNFTLYATAGSDCISTSGIFNYVIKEVAANTYRVYVRWDKVGGGAREEVIVVYKI